MTEETHPARRVDPDHRTKTRVCAALLTAALLQPSAFPVPEASAQAGGTITLLGQLGLPGTRRNSDVWGWVDPATSKEYAIVGKYPSVNTDLFLIDVSDPANPTIAKTITNGPAFDMKTWGSYLYAVDGNASGIDSKIYDISDPLNPDSVGVFASAHNIFIDGGGYMYAEFPGLRIYDLNPNPANPQLLWEKATGDGHDALAEGNRLYDFHGNSGTFIYDITNRANPVLLGSITDPSIEYHHSGWTSKDGRYLFINDELGFHPTPDFTVWDISDPANPQKVGQYADATATIHNSYRLGNFLYAAYYSAGFRVFDISDPANFFLADEYDTSNLSGENFEGAWGAYPFTPSGNIYVSDEQNGLFIFKFTPAPTAVKETRPGPFVLNQNFPNPFNPNTTITYHLAADAHVSLVIFNAMGEKIRTLVDATRSAGPHGVSWNGRDDGGRPVASGVYFYRIRAHEFAETRRMILLK